MDKRPKCAEKAADLNQPVNILERLLAIELDRLETAIKIERERNIVFPETSIIIHDIERLTREINKKGKPSQEDGTGGIDALFNELSGGKL